MKVAIVGGRDFCNYTLFNKIIEKLFKKSIFKKVTEIVSGGARGVDSLAEKYANEHDIKIEIFLPNWNKYGKSAGYKRNTKIISGADICIAFWDGVSKGTGHSIKLSKELKKTLIIVKYQRKMNNFKIKKIYLAHKGE